MKSCIKCKLHYPDGTNFCSSCGGKVTSPGSVGTRSKPSTACGFRQKMWEWFLSLPLWLQIPVAVLVPVLVIKAIQLAYHAGLWLLGALVPLAVGWLVLYFVLGLISKELATSLLITFPKLLLSLVLPAKKKKKKKEEDDE